MFTAVEHAFVSFLVPPLRICVCVFGRGLLATCHPPLTLAIGGIHYFHLQGIPSIIIQGWSYINSDATWRMRTVLHTSESEEREPSTASFTNYSRVDRDEDVLYNCAVR